jgi:N-glycosylase/DNA lyase
MKNILDKINRADEIQAKLELDKTELAKHEVELGSVDDLKELNAKYKDLIKRISENQIKIEATSSRVNKAKAELKKATEEEATSKSVLASDITRANEVLNLSDTATSNQTRIAKQVLDQAKQLGIDVKTIPAYNESFSWSTPLEQASIKLRQFISKLK